MGFFTKKKKTTDEPDPLKELAGMVANSKVQNDTLILPSQGINIRIEHEKSEDSYTGSFLLHFHISSMDWDREIFETQVSYADTREEACRIALLTFRTLLLDVLLRTKGVPDDSFTSSYAHQTHRYNVWKSSVVNHQYDEQSSEMTKAEVQISDYWEILKEGVIKRLGNQSLCYVKVYWGIVGEKRTIEVRLNDVSVPELSVLLEDRVPEASPYLNASSKQFFILKQDPATHASPSPYTEEMIRSSIGLASEIFMKHWDDDFDFINCLNEIAENLNGDLNLAEELLGLIPEICTQIAFPMLHLSDEVTIKVGESFTYKVFLEQLASYCFLVKGVYNELNKGIPNEAYVGFINLSSSFGIVYQMLEAQDQESGSELPPVTVNMTFGFTEYYELR
jgi:hypothetical protein